MSTGTTSSSTVAAVSSGDAAALDWAALRAIIQGRLRRLTGTDRAAVGVVLLHLVPVTWLVAGGGLYLDDLRAQAYARGRSLWPFIVESNGTHLAPGARLVDWLQATYWPLEQWPATVATLLLHVALGAALWLLLRELVGPRLGAVVVLAIGLFSPALVPMTAWFRQMLTTGSVTVCALLVVLAAVRYARAPGPRRLLLVVLPVVVGLLFSERALAAAAAAVAAVLLLPTGRTLRARIVLAAPLSVALGVVSVAYLAVYAQGSYDRGQGADLTAVDAARLFWRAIVTGVVPALLGGPLAWSRSGPAFSIVDPATLWVVGAWAVVLVGGFMAARGGRLLLRVLGPAAAVMAYVLPVLAMVFVGRYAQFGEATGDDLRLYGDCAMALLVAAAVALLGLRGEHSRPARNRHSVSRPAVRASAVLVPVTVVAGLVSWSGFATNWHTNASAAYLQHLDQGLDRLARLATSPPGIVLSSPVPDSVLPAWFGDELTTADLVLLTHPEQNVAVADGKILAADPTGRLRADVPRVIGGAFEPIDGYCGVSLDPAPAPAATISLPRRVPYYRGMLLRVQMLTLGPTPVVVDVVDGAGTPHRVRPPAPVTLDAGPHTALMPVPVGVDVAAVIVHAGPDHVCVPNISVVIPGADS